MLYYSQIYLSLQHRYPRPCPPSLGIPLGDVSAQVTRTQFLHHLLELVNPNYERPLYNVLSNNNSGLELRPPVVVNSASLVWSSPHSPVSLFSCTRTTPTLTTLSPSGLLLNQSLSSPLSPSTKCTGQADAPRPAFSFPQTIILISAHEGTLGQRLSPPHPLGLRTTKGKVMLKIIAKFSPWPVIWWICMDEAPGCRSLICGSSTWEELLVVYYCFVQAQRWERGEKMGRLWRKAAAAAGESGGQPWCGLPGERKR